MTSRVSPFAITGGEEWAGRARKRLDEYWTLRQFRRAEREDKVNLSQSIQTSPVQGVTMSEITTWMQNNWNALGTLLIQLGFLVAGIWLARNILRTMRAFQEQIGALVKLSVTGGIGERTAKNGVAERSFSSVSPYWLAPGEPLPAGLPEPHESGPGRWAVARERVMVWLQAPMSSGDAAAWRKAMKWLQSPVGS
jgi:hypothetical protein